ncbi:MAG: benzoyl-CoA 2,3-epoxidase subunit BoxB, partial [Alphaproteobacteria bacterium]|nr:benzoyl-CoA 2,3-epoxidase subunit BoxB [Alphaproteobacteria bacterium]
LSRTCRIMLTEEAHHMFVGETGVGRVIQRACELMKEHGEDNVRKMGGIDLPTLQKYLNFHFSVSLDLFGSERSTNAANFYSMGLKGRFEETKISDDHKLGEALYPILELEGGKFVTNQDNALTVINERLRDDYVIDCDRGVRRWNQILKRQGIDFELKLPHRAFNRQIGSFNLASTAGARISPEGQVITEAERAQKQGEWLPSDADRAYVISLMQPVTEPGKYAAWIAPPARGINNQPIDFEYVRLN